MKEQQLQQFKTDVQNIIESSIFEQYNYVKDRLNSLCLENAKKGVLSDFNFCINIDNDLNSCEVKLHYKPAQESKFALLRYVIASNN